MRRTSLPRRAAPIAILLLFVAGCGPGGALRVRLDPGVKRPGRGVVLFICDGCSLDVLQDGCRDGWCPNIRDRFVAGGTCVEDAITCVPSITYAVLTTYATGVTPASHGVLANEWFDPALRLYRNYRVIRHYRDVNGDFCVPTVFERMQPGVSVSIQDAVHRGVTKNMANWAMSGVRWFFGDFTSVDKLTATTLEDVARWANQNRRWPDLLVCYFPGVDSVGHEFGPQSQRYRSAIEDFDYQLGRVCDWLQAEGLLETTRLVLVSDHGFAPVQRDGYIDLERWLRKQLHRRVTAQPFQDDSLLIRDLHFEGFDTVVVTSATRFAMIYFRGRLGWDDPLPPDELRTLLESVPSGQRLWDNPGIDLAVYFFGKDEAELRSPRGTARVVERAGETGPEYLYLPEPDDVFAYTDDPALAEFVAAGYHSSRDWLAATSEQQYPDVVPHLIPLLRNRRSGDVLLFAAYGYGFTHEKGGHGGIRRAEMRIPLMFAGPGIPAGAVLRGPAGQTVAARAVDLVPTMLDMLGCEPAPDTGFEGLSLWPLLSAEPPEPQGQP